MHLQTFATLATFLLAMILHPEAFAKAQAEIDRVVGFERLPDFQDRSSLPYVESVVKEVYRYGSLPFHTAPHVMLYHHVKSWHCPVPLGPSFLSTMTRA